MLQETTQPRAETFYAFDVIAPAPDSSSGGSSSAMPRLAKRRVFAVTQSTKPDGIKVDSNGNGEQASARKVQDQLPSGTLLSYRSLRQRSEHDGMPGWHPTTGSDGHVAGVD
jgi:hypothetical protein